MPGTSDTKENEQTHFHYKMGRGLHVAESTLWMAFHAILMSTPFTLDRWELLGTFKQRNGPVSSVFQTDNSDSCGEDIHYLWGVT